ncbi:hypothetical protein DY000_02027677 [Brassica cretica]|uniref:Uncharacterized protein n=1 Tax=Brassica cretica TaxID=69181 RepID=A0ABQ7E3J9_BRACR|nr:hypothetical protein DY000_02027677 [Brassica cretica]
MSLVVEDPNGEKILEEEDWMIDGDTFDDDDLMDEDELLYDENQKEDEIVSPRDTGTTPRSIEAHTIPENASEEEKAEEKLIGIGVKITEPRLRRDGSSSSPSLQTPSKRKKGSPNHIATGLSLRKRNLLVGRASPKIKEVKD